MHNIQFKFSLGVGVAICLLGYLIQQKDPVGLALATVGAFILALTLLSKLTAASSQHYSAGQIQANKVLLKPLLTNRTGH